MRRITLPMIMAFLTIGCTTQPAPSNGTQKSNDETLSKNKVKVFTLETPISFGGTHITAESGSHITITPNSIKGY